MSTTDIIRLAILIPFITIIALDAIVYGAVLWQFVKNGNDMDEWKSNGWYRFIPGSGFFLYMKYHSKL